MTTILTAIIGQFWPYILAGLGLIAFAIRQRSAGAKAERAKQAERDAEARDIGDRVDNDIGAMPPAEAREALKKWSR